MIKLPEYTKPIAEYKPEAQLLLGKPCYVQEKIDGSQFSFAFLEGRFYARSRNQIIHEDHGIPDLFAAAYMNAKSLCESGSLPENVIFRAEALKGPKHNTLKYSRAPHNNFVVFDMQDALTGEYLFDRPGCVEHTSVLEQNLVFTDRHAMVEWAAARADMQSQLGGAIEGFVFKEHTHKPERACVKVVRDEFKELHAGNPDWERVGNKKGLDKVLLQLGSAARYTKALSHLKESGEFTRSMRDMPGLMRELQKDLETDCADIKELLWKAFEKEIKRQVGGGLALWYKDQLRALTDTEAT